MRTDPGRVAKYVPLYEPVTICRPSVVSHSGDMDNTRTGHPASDLPGTSLAGGSGWGLYVVERRLPAMTERGLVMLHSALTLATARFSISEDLGYLWSIFIPGQDRLLSLFAAATLDLVRVVNDASLIPYIGIESARYLNGRAPEASV